MTRDAATGFARALVDEWARAGVTVAGLAPGSRSTPLALALAADDRFRLEVFLDERSASYFALGAAKATGRPALVVTTSGTAAATLHPAVIEAQQSRAPLLVCTADRPPELRGTGANQAIDQIKLFGDAVRWFVEVGVPDDVPGAGRYWRSLAARSVAEAAGPPAGPVHLNLAFREPLVPTGRPVVDAPGRPSGEPWVRNLGGRRVEDRAHGVRLADVARRTRRGVIVGGWGSGADPAAVGAFAAASGWPVLADAVSGLRRGPLAISTYDLLLRDNDFAAAHRPDVVLRLGAAPTGRVGSGWLDDTVEQVLVDPDGSWLDPRRVVAERLAADPTPLLEAAAAELGGPAPPPGHRGEWLDGWVAAETAGRRAVDDLVDSWEVPFEGRVARDVNACLPDGSTLVVGSSMPVRDLESFARPRTGLSVIANRGASGIDGFTSTVLGAAAVSPGPVAALAGDLTLLHDIGGLLGASRRGIEATMVVLDNNGGGVFSFLPQAANPEHFERLFGTPHDLDLVALAQASGVPAVTVGRADEVVPAVLDALARGGFGLVVVPTDRADNVTRHRRVAEAVAAALAAHT